MSKKYNIEKRSDMQRFHHDTMKIESIAEEKAKSIYEETCTQNINCYDTVFSHSKVECPNCYNKVSVYVQFAEEQSV